MQCDLTNDLCRPATAFFANLTTAWNAGDGDRYGAEFADVTDFVTIRGEHLHGGTGLIAAGHQGIFDTIYRGSTNTIRLDRTTRDRSGAASSCMQHPRSTRRRDHSRARIARKMSAVLVEHDGVWKATAFHNTLITL